MSSFALALAFTAVNLRLPEGSLRWWIESSGFFVGNVKWLDLGLGLRSKGWGREREDETVILVVPLA